MQFQNDLAEYFGPVDHLPPDLGTLLWHFLPHDVGVGRMVLDHFHQIQDVRLDYLAHDLLQSTLLTLLLQCSFPRLLLGAR